jgi:unsaturated chondroitin disaccharide hydrolase
MLNEALVQDACDRLVARVDVTAGECVGRYPHAGDPRTGSWSSRAQGIWTDGFWPALLWLAFDLTKNPDYVEMGVKTAIGLSARVNQASHDIGFLFYYSAVLGWQRTKDSRLREIGIAAADQLAAMRDPVAGVIPVGRHADVVTGVDDVTIDCMMNLQLLWWAAVETGRRSYWDVAIEHAERSAQWHPRPDGSCVQSVHFDQATGASRLKHTHQGATADGCWARGLAWCCYGFAEAYRETRRKDFLRVARRAFDYHREHAPADGITFNDYDDPRIPDAPLDTSAAAILASAFLSLCTTADPRFAHRLLKASAQILKALISRHLTPIDAADVRPPGMLLHGCYNESAGEAVDHELIWGDYYLLEALTRWRTVMARL